MSGEIEYSTGFVGPQRTFPKRWEGTCPLDTEARAAWILANVTREMVGRKLVRLQRALHERRREDWSPTTPKDCQRFLAARAHCP